MSKPMSDYDQKAWHFCYGQIFHPDYTPERIWAECNEKFPGHTLSFKTVETMWQEHQQRLKSGEGH